MDFERALRSIPNDYEAYLKFENVESWPNETTSEQPLHLDTDKMMLGTQEDIIKVLFKTCPLQMSFFDKVEKNLAAIDTSLHYYADYLVTDDRKMDWLEDRCNKGNAIEDKKVDENEGDEDEESKAFITEVGISDHIDERFDQEKQELQDQSSPPQAVQKPTKTTIVSSQQTSDGVPPETKKHDVDFCVFPGFHAGEMMELPGQLEAPPILNRVTKFQNFKSGFKKFWKKVFLSEASVAVMKDLFWWFFIDVYKSNMAADKDQLFDRIADSFCAMFVSIHPDVKDKFLQVYPDCLAQAVYITYLDAFPESSDKFNDTFKQRLIDLINEWTSGIKRQPGQWRQWKLNESSGRRTGRSRSVVDTLTTGATGPSLDTDSFLRLVDSLGETTAKSTSGKELVPIASLPSPSSQLLKQASDISIGATHIYNGKESHQIGPGSKLERMKFDLQGLSPLITHCIFKGSSASECSLPGIKVRRTEIAAEPGPRGTYQELIAISSDNADRLKKEYKRICDKTDSSLVHLEHTMVKTHREIDVLEKELATTKNVQDLKDLGQKIISWKERTRENALALGKNK